MEQVLVDTSVWIDYFKDAKTSQCDFLDKNVTNLIIATCPTIVQEVLQGVVSDRDEQIVSSHFTRLFELREEPYQIGIQAAELYRFLRKQGVTIRKPNDCLIAMFAIKNNIPLLHNDKDFDFIAAHTALKVVG